MYTCYRIICHVQVSEIISRLARCEIITTQIGRDGHCLRFSDPVSDSELRVFVGSRGLYALTNDPDSTQHILAAVEAAGTTIAEVSFAKEADGFTIMELE
jgi:hypothetical protein